MSEVEHFLAAKNKLGEGPVWNPAEQALYWVDIESHCFHRLYPTTGAHEVFSVGLPVGVLALRAAGGLIMATKRGFAFWAGTIENRRPFIHTPAEEGIPDGLAVDSEGFT